VRAEGIGKASKFRSTTLVAWTLGLLALGSAGLFTSAYLLGWLRPWESSGAATSSKPPWYRLLTDDQLKARLPDGGTWLHAAVDRPAPADAITYLISRGLDVNGKDEKNRTPLRRAVDLHDEATCRVLVAAGAKVSPMDLQELIAAKHYDGLDLSLKLGTDPNAADVWFGPALLYSALARDERASKLLLDAGADPNRKGPMLSVTNSGCEDTAIFVASAFPMPKLLLALLKKAPDPRSWGTAELSNYTPLHLSSGAAGSGGRLIRFNQVVERVAGREHVDEPDETQRVEAVRLLLDHGADTNAKDDRGDTALMHAANRNFVQVAQLLIQRGAHVNDGLPVHRLLRGWRGSESLPLLRLLLVYKPDLVAKDGDGKNALECAQKRCPPDVIKLLEAAR
jgi:ankyrin repeat protein